MFLQYLLTPFTETPAKPEPPAGTTPAAIAAAIAPAVSPTGVLGSDESLKTGEVLVPDTAADQNAGTVEFTKAQQATMQSIINKNHGKWLDAGKAKALEDLGFKPEHITPLKGIFDRLGLTPSNLAEMSNGANPGETLESAAAKPGTKPTPTDNRFTQLESTIDDQSKQLKSQQNLITSLQESNQRQSETSKRKEMQSQAMGIVALQPLAEGVQVDEVVEMMIRNWRVNDDLTISIVDSADVPILGLDGNPLDFKVNGENFFKERPFLLRAGASGAGASSVIGGQSNPLIEAITNYTQGSITKAITENPELRIQLTQALVPQSDINPYAKAQLKTGGTTKT